METPASATPRPTRPLWQRLLHSFAVMTLTLACIVILAIATFGWVTPARATFDAFLHGSPEASPLAAVITIAAIILLPVILVVVAERKGWLRWPVIAGGALLILPLLGWLAWDEQAIRQPLTMEELSPAFSGAEKSYTVLMRYKKNSADPEAKAYEQTRLALQWSGPPVRDSAKWREWVLKNREKLEADWATLAPQRTWFAELAAYDRIGDLTASSIDAEIMQFQVWRTLSQRTSATATLQAIDGQRDDAIATLLPMLQTARRLQIYSRTLVRSMIAVVIERMMLETAAFVLELGPVAPTALAGLDAALAGENGPALARRILLIEYALFGPVFRSMRLGDALQMGFSKTKLVRRPLNLVSGLLFNPNATTNLYGARVYELAALAETRELGKFSVRSKGLDDELRRENSMKNLGGRLVLNLAVPAYEKIVESVWKTADLRVELRKQIAARSALAKI